MNCNTPQTITQTIQCAKVCYTRQTNPTAKMLWVEGSLTDDSTYFDGSNFHQIGWLVYIDDYLFTEIGYGETGEQISGFINGSTYDNLILGTNNEDLLDYLAAIPNTQIPIGSKFTIYIRVKDIYGLESQNISNKYTFTK